MACHLEAAIVWQQDYEPRKQYNSVIDIAHMDFGNTFCFLVCILQEWIATTASLVVYMCLQLLLRPSDRYYRGERLLMICSQYFISLKSACSLCLCRLSCLFFFDVEDGAYDFISYLCTHEALHASTNPLS
jgi:hypothetical protein